MFSPSGEEIVLVDVGQRVLYDDPVTRVWEVQLEPGETHPWHLHHNPYVVLSIDGSEGRMDWLDGSEPRFISEHRGGWVYRPVSPVHRLTNIGKSFYRNRLVELKDLGEHQSAPLGIHPDDVSVRTVADCSLDLDGPHVLAALDIEDVRLHPGGPCSLDGEWFVVELAYLFR
ncbi:MAG: beta-alanine degradation protein BauB [Pseudonocardiales bacterium]|nr:beta-alanine degradation protein BauB [Pseudonocardiales bacterium]